MTYAAKWSIIQTVAPVLPAVSLVDAKLHLKMDDTADDALITSLVSAATSQVESYIGRSLITRTLILRMDYFPYSFYLPRGPVSSVTGITYLDQLGALQVLAPSVYIADTYAADPAITLAYNQVWPDTYDQINSVVVTYVAGYGAAVNTVPYDIIAAIKLALGDLYMLRETMVIGTSIAESKTFQALLAPYKTRWRGISADR